MSPRAIVLKEPNGVNLVPHEGIFDISPVAGWKPLLPTDQVFGIFVVFIVLLTLFLVYWIKLRKADPLRNHSSFVLLMQMLFVWAQDTTADLIGEENKKFTPYFLMLLLYLVSSNLIGLLGGISPPTSSLTFTFSLGLATFLGIVIMGIRYQRWSFFKSFTFNITIKGKKYSTLIPNPLSFLGDFAPLFSISLRLWGNILGGTLILALFYNFWFFAFSTLSNKPLALSLGAIFAGILTPALHVYFDVVVGTLQGYVFVMLTYNYWAKMRNIGLEESQEAAQRLQNLEVAKEIIN
ncbi:F0F1 ATP synthase subunit A [Mycoplasmoides pneumoniae]|uniref:F0F1 ATP synthase subunit A n=1 Tax=Mycoplasmoides pneumoniae TaxID=2104 RepID=UPI0006A71F75|nr:F0F1 ATP synthase subunit A [Mycoplasmoides pneumoniae]ALA32579.1 ATP synthase F0F1 subunit A [Mycoplasmoides pneumoniae 51494]